MKILLLHYALKIKNIKFEKMYFDIINYLLIYIIYVLVLNIFKKVKSYKYWTININVGYNWPLLLCKPYYVSDLIIINTIIILIIINTI